MASDHLWSMERQSMMTSALVYMGATMGVPVGIHIYRISGYLPIMFCPRILV